LYVTGWTYAYRYFDAFRIPMLMAEQPREHLFVYGGLVVWKNPVVSLIAALVMLGVITACAWHRMRLGRFGITAIVVLLVLLVFAVGRFGAIRTAVSDFQSQQKEDFSAYPRVRFARNDVTLLAPELSGDIDKTDCGRLVLATEENLFLIRPIRDAFGIDLDTFVIPRRELKALRLRADYTSCP
jgi:uncharacterized membrane protein